MKEVTFFKHEPADVKYLYADIQEENEVKVLCLGKVPEYHPLKIIQSSKNQLAEDFLEQVFFQYPQATKRYILISNQPFTLVPKKFFSDETKEAYLKSLTGDWDYQKQSVYCDSLDVEGPFLIYRIPNYLYSFLKSKNHITACYHLETAIRYITQKKSFIQRPNSIIIHLQNRNRCSIHGLQKNALLFMQSFEMETFHDVNYYAKYFAQTYFANISPSSLQLLVLCPQKSDADYFVREIAAEYSGLLINVFTEEDIFHSYKIRSSVHELEDFFSLFLSSICEL